MRTVKMSNAIVGLMESGARRLLPESGTRRLLPYAAPAIMLLMTATSSYALDWPPTAADVAAMFADVIVLIGEIVAAIAVAAAGLYGGVVAIKAGFDFFSKFYRASKTAA